MMPRSHHSFLSCFSHAGLTFILVTGMGSLPSHASQVTTERIIVQPDYSSSGAESPALLGPNGEESGRSGTLLDGEQRSMSPNIGADGYPLEDTRQDGFVDFGPPPPILRDMALLPAPVRRMHEALLAATRTGDLDAMQLPIEMNELQPAIGIDGDFADPIPALQAMAGDPDGIEILAILSEILETGFVHIDKGTPQEMYVWPYFAHIPLRRLTRPQRVELFRLITARDYEEMDAIGHYTFFRLGIGPDGTWHYLIAGE